MSIYIGVFAQYAYASVQVAMHAEKLCVTFFYLPLVDSVRDEAAMSREQLAQVAPGHADSCFDLRTLA